MGIGVGTRLGPYEVTAPLGAGGMGEVYRAHDTKLGRAVALKILPADVAADVDRLARFEREAKTLAALNHPHIAQVYGFEDGTDVRALVMELVPGESLADRLARGTPPIREALELASQIASGLEAAHEQGIVHRDLKPANVQVTLDHQVKILDFGLAKVAAAGAEAPGPRADDEGATRTSPAQLTQAGVVLGTAAYMSPEQARGLPVDTRTDVWAFGALLFEMLTGARPFPGPTFSDTLAQVLEREPDWTSLPGTTPTAVRRLLQRCLRKDPRRRLRDIADARLEIDDVLAAMASGAIDTAAWVDTDTRPAWWKGRLPWIVATGGLGLVAATALWMEGRAPAAAPQGVKWMQVAAPFLTLAHDNAFDISRDGKRLVYVGEQEGTRRLYLRRLDSRESTPIPGTEGALCPFFAPDGQSIGFWADQKLKAVSLSGGWTPLYDNPLHLWAAPLMSSWGADGHILFPGVGARGVVRRIREGGGTPEEIMRADPKSEWYLHTPQLLPDGDHVMTTAFLPGQRVIAQSIKTGERRTLVEDAYAARYAPTRHLVYMQADKILAVPFDPERIAVTGSPVVMVDGVSTWNAPAGAGYSLSDEGTLAFLGQSPTAGSPTTLVWVDREGREEIVPSEGGQFAGASISPDGRRLATWRWDDSQLYVLDLDRGTLTRLTSDGSNYWSVWSPSGRRLVFNAERGDSTGTSLYVQAADGGTPAERLTTTELMQQPRSFSPDGSMLVYQELDPETGYDIWTLPMSGGATPTPLMKTRHNEYQPRLSPDGKWLAYVSNESGRDEVWVRAFPSMDQRTQISIEGGGDPAWSRDSRELFYLASDNPTVRCRVMAVSVDTSSGLRAGAPRKLFEGPYVMTPMYGQSYDVAPDGKRFVMVKYVPQTPPREIYVALNWFEELKATVANGTR